jgi:hypothetical protein
MRFDVLSKLTETNDRIVTLKTSLKSDKNQVYSDKPPKPDKNLDTYNARGVQVTRKLVHHSAKSPKKDRLWLCRANPASIFARKTDSIIPQTTAPR